MRFGTINKLYFRVSLTASLLFAGNLLFGQGIDNILRYKSIEEIRARIADLERENQDNPGVIYLKAAIESDGKKAIEYYEKLVLQHPRSSYADDAKFKIGQYYFSVGFYNLALEQLRELVWQYPNSPLRDDGAYYATQCLVAMNREREAIQELRKFQKDFPKSQLVLLAEEDVRKLESEYSAGSELRSQPQKKEEKLAVPQESKPDLKKNDSSNSESTRSLSNMRYSIQVGAFLALQNAQNQKAYFEKEGMTVQILTKQMNNRQLYAVCVNQFDNHWDAVRFGEVIREKYRISVQIVNLNEFQ